jgi:hypothetical protein
MNRETAKGLLENGVLQAYANGEIVQIKIKRNNEWETWHEYNFDDEPECYRIKPKPQFKEGDLVKSIVNGRIGTVVGIVPIGVQINHLGDSRSFPSCASIHHPNILVHVKKVQKSHTFETAVKACAEHGFELKKDTEKRILLGLHALKCYWITAHPDNNVQGSSEYQCLMFWSHKNGTPFAQIKYEEIA